MVRNPQSRLSLSTHGDGTICPSHCGQQGCQSRFRNQDQQAQRGGFLAGDWHSPRRVGQRTSHPCGAVEAAAGARILSNSRIVWGFETEEHCAGPSSGNGEARGTEKNAAAERSPSLSLSLHGDEAYTRNTQEEIELRRPYVASHGFCRGLSSADCLHAPGFCPATRCEWWCRAVDGEVHRHSY